MNRVRENRHRILFWIVFVLLFPPALCALVFQPAYIFPAAIFFVYIRYVHPRLFRRSRFSSGRRSVIATECFLFLLALVYYTSDNRERECVFEPDPRVVPVLTYGQCLKMDERRKNDCLRTIGDPYTLGFYKNELLVISGRNDSYLGRIPLDRGGKFSSEHLGFGNVQQVVVDEPAGRAVMPMWKQNKIMIYDLEHSKPERYLGTGVSKLIGAERHGDDVFIISESPFLYKLSLKDYSLEEFRLPYRHFNLYNLKIDPAKGMMYITDWVWGIVYRHDLRRMEPAGEKFIGGGATGLSLDSAACELFVTMLLFSRIDVLDCDSLRRMRSIKTGFGGHETVLSGAGDRIYLIKYFGGKFLEIDRKSGRILAGLNIGGQARAIILSEKNGKLFVASKCGVFEIRPDAKRKKTSG